MLFWIDEIMISLTGVPVYIYIYPFALFFFILFDISKLMGITFF